jgi:hypothetical protein
VEWGLLLVIPGLAGCWSLVRVWMGHDGDGYNWFGSLLFLLVYIHRDAMHVDDGSY